MNISYWNKNRAARARKALFAHQLDECNGSRSQARIELRSDPAAVLRWLLADLRHWCDKEGISFHEQDAKAHDTYTTEVTEARRADLDRQRKGGAT